MRVYHMDGVSQAYRNLMHNLDSAKINCSDAIEAIDEAPPGFYDPTVLKIWSTRLQHIQALKRAIETGEF